MWYLTSENNRVIYITPQNKVITIGRSIDGSTCNFAIPDDSSISRKHASLTLTDNGIILQDLGSRYGTFINNAPDRVEINIPVIISENDIIKFGKLSSVWRVNVINFVTCTSTLKGENLQNLKACLAMLGGTLKNEWDETCLFLTMPAITLTIKVVLALVQGSQIVTLDYWNKCITAINENVSLPDPNDYIPQIVESTLNKEIVSFSSNPSRKLLFNGKKIVFFSRKQFDMYKTVLSKSSGTPLLLSETKMTKAMLCEQDVIVIQYNMSNTETQVSRNQINDVVNHLKMKDKRVVADAEIGLAVLYCNIDKYCNPNFNFSSEVMKQPNQIQQKTSKVLVQESQDYKNVQDNRENIIINESLTENLSTSNNSKRKLSGDDNDIQENANKKIATDNTTLTNIRSAKRKGHDDASSNPSKRQATEDIDNNDDDMFNFITPVSNTTNNVTKDTEKRLNLLKPLKRKHDISENDEDGLFKFVDDKLNKSTDDTSKSNIFSTKISHEVNDEIEEEIIVPKKIITEQNVDISQLRGSKLDELMKSNLDNTVNGNSNIQRVKKEVHDDLDSKMSSLDLGTTIVTIKKELIVKKEPVMVESCDSYITNFKKFKKVWPLKMQITVIPGSSSITVPQETFQENETCSQSYD